jgi:hypothetical protein
MARPVCSGTSATAPTLSLWAAISLVVGVVQFVYGLLTAFIKGSPSWLETIAKQIVGELEKDVLTFILNAFGVDYDLTIMSYFTAAPGLGFFYVATAFAAAITAAVMIYWAWKSFSNLCGAPTFGAMACVSGVVNNVVPALSTPHSVLFGFTGNQPRADVVVKSIYWPFVTQGSPAFVLCAPCDNCPPSADPPDTSNGCSPEVPCFYHSSKVCGASLGGAIGATIGAAIGAVLGVLAGVAVLAAIGCGLTGPLVVFCWFAVLVGVIVAIAITAAVALIGAIGGSLIGQAASGGSSVPTSGGTVLTPGTYVTIMGNLAAAPQANGANSIWFAGWVPNAATGKVDDDSASNSNGTSILGHSSGTPPFCFTDPDANITPAMDLCPPPPA